MLNTQGFSVLTCIFIVLFAKPSHLRNRPEWPGRGKPEQSRRTAGSLEDPRLNAVGWGQPTAAFLIVTVVPRSLRSAAV